jgi:hypothetical protein
MALISDADLEKHREQMCWVNYADLNLHEKYNFYTTFQKLIDIASRDHTFTVKRHNAPGIIHIIGKDRTVPFYWQKIANQGEVPKGISNHISYWLYLPCSKFQKTYPQTAKYRLFLG